jgi:WD40-like Beta Propeller Repeat
MDRTRYMVGVVISVAVVVLTTSQPIGAPKFSDWAAPTNLGPPINSLYDEAGPAISKDGLSLYFTSNHPGGFGNFDIWVSERRTEDDAWGQPINLGGVMNTSDSDTNPALSRDGHWLFFNSLNRPGGFGGLDIWASWREHTHDNFDWGPPFNLGPGVNSTFGDANPSYFENDEGGAPLLFFQKMSPGIAPDIYVSALGPNGLFGPATPVSELNSLEGEQRPSVRFDGLEIFFVRNPPTITSAGDLWVATRPSVTAPWSTPVILGAPISTMFQDSHPYIAADRQTLFFTSDRPGGFGALDLYVTTRTKNKP